MQQGLALPSYCAHMDPMTSFGVLLTKCHTVVAESVFDQKVSSFFEIVASAGVRSSPNGTPLTGKSSVAVLSVAKLGCNTHAINPQLAQSCLERVCSALEDLCSHGCSTSMTLDPFLRTLVSRSLGFAGRCGDKPLSRFVSALQRLLENGVGVGAISAAVAESNERWCALKLVPTANKALGKSGPKPEHEHEHGMVRIACAAVRQDPDLVLPPATKAALAANVSLPSCLSDLAHPTLVIECAAALNAPKGVPRAFVSDLWGLLFVSPDQRTAAPTVVASEDLRTVLGALLSWSEQGAHDMTAKSAALSSILRFLLDVNSSVYYRVKNAHARTMLLEDCTEAIVRIMRVSEVAADTTKLSCQLPTPLPLRERSSVSDSAVTGRAALLSDCESLISRLREALAQGDSPRSQVYVHSISFCIQSVAIQSTHTLRTAILENLFESVIVESGGKKSLLSARLAILRIVRDVLIGSGSKARTESKQDEEHGEYMTSSFSRLFLHYCDLFEEQVRESLTTASPKLENGASVVAAEINSLVAQKLPVSKWVADAAELLVQSVVHLTWPVSGLCYAVQVKDASCRRDVAVAVLRLMLPQIAALLEGGLRKPVKQFRALWMLLVWHDFSILRDRYTDPTAVAVSKIALEAPPLLSLTTSSYTSAIADILALEKHFRTSSVPTARSFHQRLARICAEVQTESFAEAFLYLAIMELELRRVHSGGIVPLLTYHQCELRELSTIPRIEALAMSLTNKATEIIKHQFLSLRCKSVSQQARQLIFFASFAPTRVRRAAALLLNVMAGAVPEILADRDLLRLLLSLVHLAHSEDEKDLQVFCERNDFLISWSSLQERTDLRKALTEMASQWVLSALHADPHSVVEEVTAFMLEQRELQLQVEAHVGIAVALNAVLGAADRREGAVDRPLAGPLPNIPLLLMWRSSSIGELRAMLRDSSDVAHVVRQNLSGSVTECLKSLSRASVMTAKRLAELGSPHPEDATPESEVASKMRRFIDAMHLCAAWLCSQKAHPRTAEIVRWFTQGPIQIFSPLSIQTGIACWKWTLHERPDLCHHLLGELVDGWLWSVNQQLGLFDAFRPDPIRVVENGAQSLWQTRQGPVLYSEEYAAHSPHSLLCTFIEECFLAPSATSSDARVLRYLLSLTEASLSKVTSLSLKDSSFSEHFHSVLLWLSTVQKVHTACFEKDMPIVPPAVLGRTRQSLYRALLQWFKKKASWYHTQQLQAANKDLAVLQEIIQRLQVERVWLAQSSVGFMENAAPSDAVSTSIVWTPVPNSQVFDQNTASPRVHITAEQKHVYNLLGLLRLLLRHEHERLFVWAHPTQPRENTGSALSETGASPGEKAALWKAYVETAMAEDAEVVLRLSERFNMGSAAWINKHVTQLVSESPLAFCHIPEALPYYLTDSQASRGAPALRLWSRCSITGALRLLGPMSQYPAVQQFALDSLQRADPQELVTYLPTLMQCLRSDASTPLQLFLVQAAKQDSFFAHQLLWALRTEAQERAGEKQSPFAVRCSKVFDSIVSAMDAKQREEYQTEFGFVDGLLEISGALKPVEKAKRREQLREMLQRPQHTIPPNGLVYLPTDSSFLIQEIVIQNASPMQSAAKCPILVPFRCSRRQPEATDDAEDADLDPTADTPREGRKLSTNVAADVFTKACILKMGDDCRQDQLALQLILIVQRVLDAVAVPSFLFAYHVITTGRGCGIIECVPNTKSRDQIGKLVEGNLCDYFVQRHGHPNSVGFKKARDNFIRSMASYSVVSYILNIKDRHNGNLLIDDDGHIIHIDFGFIFDTSPGGDINFESSPFKLTTEMLQLMGDESIGAASDPAMVSPDAYHTFMETTIRGYLAVREYTQQLRVLVELMLQSGLPCFKPQKTISDMLERLSQGKTEVEAAEFVRERITESRDNIRTRMYDQYQHFAEGIEM